jgi:glutamate carboxypeptidase
MDFDLKTYRDDLEYLVNIDSGSRCIDGVNRVTDWFADRYRAMGWSTKDIVTEPEMYGKSTLVKNTDSDDFDLLILCHVDTVFPDETAKNRPFGSTEDRFTGPGVADMKAGCLMALMAFEQISANSKLEAKFGVLLNGEHEISCPTIRPVIEQLSKKSKLVVTTEPARADGSCVRQRKGILRYHLQFHGKTAHSGVNPEDGVCAITEMAHMILVLKELEDPEVGITVNPGLVEGGQSVNTIPHYASCNVDIRVIRPEDSERMDQTVRSLVQSPKDSRVKIELAGGITRPPLVPTPRGDEVMHGLNAIAANYGIDLKWAFSGGGSDASYASAMGIPSLCGLGPVGGGYHTEKEYLETGDLQARLCMFRDFLRAVDQKSI